MKLELQEKDFVVVLRRLEADLNILNSIRGENWSFLDVESLQRAAVAIRALVVKDKKTKKSEELKKEGT
jgi:hypothetical protein